MLTREILARLDASKTELRGILETHQGNALPDEVATRADAIEAEIGRLDVALRRSALIEDADRRSPGRPLDGGSPGQAECRAFEGASSPVPQGFDGALLRSQHGDRVPALEARHRLSSFLPASESRAGELALAGFLRMMVSGPRSDLERRVMAEGSIGTGGALVPLPISAAIIDALIARSVAIRAGCRVIPMTSASLRFARFTSYPQGAWRAENAPIVEDTPAMDQVALNAKSWALLVRVSRELLEDAVNLDEQLRAMFAASAGLALDQAVMFGSGASNAPLGVASQPGIASVSMGTNGAQLTGYAKILDGVLALDAANANPPTAIVMSPRSARSVGGFVDSTGQPLQPPPRLAGLPQLVSASVTNAETQGTATNASSVLIGDFSQVYIGLRTQLQITVLNERFADQGQIAYVLWMRGDVAVAHPPSICRISGITP